MKTMRTTHKPLEGNTMAESESSGREQHCTLNAFHTGFLKDSQ